MVYFITFKKLFLTFGEIFMGKLFRRIIIIVCLLFSLCSISRAEDYLSPEVKINSLIFLDQFEKLQESWKDPLLDFGFSSISLAYLSDKQQGKVSREVADREQEILQILSDILDGFNKVLTEKELKVITMWVSLSNDKLVRGDKTRLIKIIGQEVGVTTTRVDQILANSKRKIRREIARIRTLQDEQPVKQKVVHFNKTIWEKVQLEEKVKKQKLKEKPQQTDIEDDISQKLQAGELDEIVMSFLTARRRLTLLLRHSPTKQNLLNGEKTRPVKDIAEAMGISPSAAKVHLNVAMRIVRRQLHLQKLKNINNSI